MFDAVCSHIASARSIYIAFHLSPDGDALGSGLGLALALDSLGKTCTVACIDPPPPYLQFLPGSERLVTRRPAGEDLIIVVDTGDASRLGDLYDPVAFSGRPLVNIDHHVSNSRFGTVNIIDPAAASVGEMVFALTRALGVPLTRNLATCLLTAMVTDTLGFRTPSTTARTLAIAAALTEADAPLSEIVQHAFDSRPLSVTRVWGEVLSTFSMQDGVAWASIPLSVFRRFGAKEDEVKGLVSMLRGTEGVIVSVLLMETPGGKVKAEFRSRGEVNVAAVAIALGGGGHRAASGCTIVAPLAEAERRALAEVRRQMDEYYGRHSQPVEAATPDIA